MRGDGVVDLLVSGKINAERFLAEQMLAGLDNITINLGMKIVGDGTIDGIYLRPSEQFLIVSGRKLEGRDAGSKPIKSFFIGVTSCHQHRPDVQTTKMNPAGRRTG